MSSTKSSKQPLSLKAAFQALTTAFKDPLTAETCGARLGVAADRIDQALEAFTSTSDKVKLAKSHPELLRVGIRFLTQSPTRKDNITLVNTLVKCNCPTSPSDIQRMLALHTRPPGRENRYGRVQVSNTWMLFDAISTLCELISLALSDLTQHKFRNLNPEEVDSMRQPWPQGPEDLLPPGPEKALERLEFWVYEAPLGCRIYKLAGSLATFYAPFANSVVQLKPEMAGRFAVIRAMGYLHAAISLWDATAKKTKDSEEQKTKFSKELHQLFDAPIFTIFDFWDTLSRCDVLKFNKMMGVTAMRLKDVFKRLEEILPGLEPHDKWRKAMGMVWLYSAYANAEFDYETGIGVYEIRRNNVLMPPPQEGTTCHGDVFEALGEVRKGGCLHIQCTAHIRIEAKHGRLCGGCNVVRYCGEKCQEEAWNNKIAPHKKLCKKVRQVREALGPAYWLSLWSPDASSDTFQAMCDEKGIERGLLEEVKKIIGVTLANKRAFTEKVEENELPPDEKERLAEQKRLKRLFDAEFIAEMEARGAVRLTRKCLGIEIETDLD